MNAYDLTDEADRLVSGLNLKQKMFEDGRDMLRALGHLQRYQGQNITFPTERQYKDLARSLDLPVPYVKKRVELFLWGE